MGCCCDEWSRSNPGGGGSIDRLPENGRDLLGPQRYPGKCNPFIWQQKILRAPYFTKEIKKRLLKFPSRELRNMGSDRTQFPGA